MTTILKSTPKIPTMAEVEASSERGANPAHLCANWRQGCSRVTDGPIGDRLTYCDDCHEIELAKHGIK